MFRRCPLPDASLLTYVCTDYGEWATMFVIFKPVGTYRCLSIMQPHVLVTVMGIVAKKVVKLNHFSNYNI